MKKLLSVAAVLLVSAFCSAQSIVHGTLVQNQSVVAFSSTPTFNAELGNAFKIVLTGNVTSSTLTKARAGQQLQFEVCQDGTGGRTFVPPTNVSGWTAISSTASACTTEMFVFDGSNAVPDMIGIGNGGTGQTTAAAAFNALSPMTTLGDLTIESGANTASRLAGNTTTTRKFLAQTGTGTVSAAPGWVQPSSSDLSDGPFLTASGTATLTNKTYGGTTLHSQIFTSSGTFTIPANITSVKVTVVGGGGAGGGGTAGGVNGGGGGSGGASIKWLASLTPGNTLAVTIGPGGTGSAGLAGGNGSASSVASGTQTITTITANGGGGGAVNSTQSNGGGGAGSGSGGDLNFGGNSGIGGATGTGGGGAGSIFGGGGGPAGNGTGNAGQANTGAGGGGAGSGGSNAGGAGGSGIVVFEWSN